MKKTILEIDPSTVKVPQIMKRIDFQELLSKIDFIEGTNLFNIDPEQSSVASMTVKKAGIFRVKLKKDVVLSDLIDPKWSTTVIEPLEEKDGVYTCFIKAQVDGLPSGLLESINFDNLLMSLPLYLSEQKFIISFIGDNETIKAYLNLLKAFGISYKVVSLQKPSQESSLSFLTERQKEILITAKSKGYYDNPRRISSKTLAQEFGISTSTLLEHLRKVEKKLIELVVT